MDGTFSAGGQMILTGAEAGGSNRTVRVTGDGPCRNFTGSYRVTDNEGPFTTAVPNSVNLATARLVAETGPPEQAPFYEERFALQYTVVE